jgi:FMN phosphatase YigB (HAD superfamily)
VRKPNPRIFAIAAERVGHRLSGAWLIGDSPEVDVAARARWHPERVDPARSAVAGRAVRAHPDLRRRHRGARPVLATKKPG